jgi:hypothetical protein
VLVTELDRPDCGGGIAEEGTVPGGDASGTPSVPNPPNAPKSPDCLEVNIGAEVGAVSALPLAVTRAPDIDFLRNLAGPLDFPGEEEEGGNADAMLRDGGDSTADREDDGIGYGVYRELEACSLETEYLLDEAIPLNGVGGGGEPAPGVVGGGEADPSPLTVGSGLLNSLSCSADLPRAPLRSRSGELSGVMSFLATLIPPPLADFRSVLEAGGPDCFASSEKAGVVGEIDRGNSDLSCPIGLSL